jgi:hypothetical protein
MWLEGGSSESDSGSSGLGWGADAHAPGLGTPGLAPRPEPSALVDAGHAGALRAGGEALFRATEQSLHWAWRVLRLTRGGPEAGPLAAVARPATREFLDRIPPHVRRGVAELLAYSTLWQAVCTRLGRPVARTHEELMRELSGDLQLLLRGAQARLGTASALEQGLLVHLGRLREARSLEPGAPLELKAAVDAFTHAVTALRAAASAYRRAWEATGAELAESAAWLEAGDPGFCAWLVEHLSGTVPAWQKAHASVRVFTELGALAGQP